MIAWRGKAFPRRRAPRSDHVLCGRARVHHVTDEMQQRVADFIREHQLEADVAETCIEESARETLETVNLYLTTVADAVKKHGGTLDKYIATASWRFGVRPRQTKDTPRIACGPRLTRSVPSAI